MKTRIFLPLLLLAAVPAVAADQPGPVPAATEAQSPRAILQAAIDVAGGDVWLNPRTLYLAGTAVFYAPDSATPRSRATDYRMWREMNPGRTDAHQADGKVRIVARDGERLLFEVGFDGTTTWTEKGVMPKAEADAYWANNFGFGIIRQALHDGFKLERAPDTDVGGHPVQMIRIIDPHGARTLFGIDCDSRYIRYMGFATPRGFHVRTYDDFVLLDNPRWLQAREVSLYYDGVKANTVYWKEVKVNGPVDGDLFRFRGK